MRVSEYTVTVDLAENHIKFGDYDIGVYKADVIKLCRHVKELQNEVENYNQKQLILSPYPNQLEPVLATIEHTNSLGKSKWYEVVYYDSNWISYGESKTFEDGEKVLEWKYCNAFV
jgi:hypothetical protein